MGQLTSTTTFMSQQIKGNLRSIIRSIAVVSTLFTWWNVYYMIKSNQQKQRLHLSFDWAIIQNLPKT